MEEGKKIKGDESNSKLKVSQKPSILSRLINREKKQNGKHEDVPQNDIEQVIANIFQEVLGVENVRYDDDFYDLGGSSLLAASLFTKINQEFGKRLPLACLFDAPTVHQLANLLRGDNQEGAWSSLVEIQSGNSKPILYFIHAEEGNVIGYRDLSHDLGADQPFYGIQAEGLSGENIPRYTIEEMASNYA